MVRFQTLFLATALLDFTVAKSCYFPNGVENNNYVPCDPDAENSACCASTDECLTNGLCRPSNSAGDGDDYWRDLCTDPLWQSDSCPKYCYNDTVSTTAAGGNFFVTACSWDTYCCADVFLWESGDTTACCSNQTVLFNAGPAKWLSGPHVSTATYSRPAPTLPPSSSLLSTSSSASSTTSTPSSKTSTSALHKSANTGEPLTPISSSSLSTGDKAGIGVAVAVVVIAILTAIAALVLLRRLRRRKAADKATQDRLVSAQHAPALPETTQLHDPFELENTTAVREMEGEVLQELMGQREMPQELSSQWEMPSELWGQGHMMSPSSTNLPELES